MNPEDLLLSGLGSNERVAAALPLRFPAKICIVESLPHDHLGGISRIVTIAGGVSMGTLRARDRMEQGRLSLRLLDYEDPEDLEIADRSIDLLERAKR